jgi:hypothetical protein
MMFIGVVQLLQPILVYLKVDSGLAHYYRHILGITRGENSSIAREHLDTIFAVVGPCAHFCTLISIGLEVPSDLQVCRGKGSNGDISSSLSFRCAASQASLSARPVGRVGALTCWVDGLLRYPKPISASVVFE